ncbi:MAG: hypothetical protein NT028_07045 [candidate division Zixibacteria bacterium]|nr:hypothetical protein [candidate division Zixibacteria bacterium]
MKKILVLVAVIMLFGMTAVYGQAIGDLKGKMAVGGFLDYGIGFGDQFKSFDYVGFTAKSSLGLSFGGKFLYGVAPKIAVKGLFDYQTESYKVTILGVEAKSSYHILEISANGMYFFSPEKKMCPYVEAGPGMYSFGDGGSSTSKIGVNAGIGGIYMINEKLAIDAGGRFHMIFTDVKKTNYVDIHAGVSFFLGGK